MSSAPSKLLVSNDDGNIPPMITPVLPKTKPKRPINTITIDKAIGKGAYGTVYRCYDESGEPLAVKCIKTKNFGVPSLIEASIMSVIHHPNLSKALKIHSSPKKLYIIQELAIADLRVYRSNNTVSRDQMIKWIYMIGEGIFCLHKYNIIHGDIKASNILVYGNGGVKITDFTLSTHTDWTNKYKPCTSTHRPLEVWLGNSWSKPVDIWAFGCTIYELVYGENLFVSQSKDSAINALLDWFNYLPKQYRGRDINIGYRDCFHYSFSLSGDFDISDSINKLIFTTLTLDPNDRPNIKTILDGDIFKGNVRVPTMIITTPVISLSPRIETKIRRTLGVYLKNEITIELACGLYCKLTGMINANDKIKLVTCAWIGHKIVERENISLMLLPCELYEVLGMEREICNYLSYRLYSETSRVVFRDNK